jgi:hypothetical protein
MVTRDALPDDLANDSILGYLAFRCLGTSTRRAGGGVRTRDHARRRSALRDPDLRLPELPKHPGIGQVPNA